MLDNREIKQADFGTGLKNFSCYMESCYVDILLEETWHYRTCQISRAILTAIYIYIYNHNLTSSEGPWSRITPTKCRRKVDEILFISLQIVQDPVFLL